MNKVIDLRSDTVTRPSQAMRQAMCDAEVGDDVFADDPTVIKLQKTIADLFRKEAALYFPSGTMANQASLKAHLNPGEEVYCPNGCHIFNYEGGAPAVLSGIVLYPLDDPRGVITSEQVRSRLRPNDHHFPVSRLIWGENTANRAGGCVFPIEEIKKLRKLADEQGLLMHLDGARIWNAVAASGIPEWDWAQYFDSVSVCLSKGLGAPVGSMVIGKADFIDRAHRARKRFGGGMRQAGILAAAGLYAIEHNRKRLVDDHRRARILAETFAQLSGFTIDLDATHTNIVIFDCKLSGKSGDEIKAVLKEHGILITQFGTWCRMVTHLDISDDDIDRTVSVLKSLFAK